MSTFFKTLIEQGFALVYIDDILLLSDSKEHMFQLIEQLHIISTSEPLAPQLARANKKYKSAIDLMYAYAHEPLDEDTIKLISFSSGDKLFAFIRGFYGLPRTPKLLYKTNVYLL